MSKKDFDYNITQTFYAKWILPFVLFIVGGLLILFFYPGMKFIKGNDYDTKEEKVFYTTKIDGTESYIGVKDKCIYEIKNKGSYEYYYNTTTTYDGKVPWYSPFRHNLSTLGVTGGMGLSIVGVFMLIVNVFNKISKVNTEKVSKRKDEDDIIDEEDDE